MRPRIDLEEDEEVEEITDVKDPAPKWARVVQCPECPFEDPSPEKMGVHLERHRPIGFKAFNRNGKPLHADCPKKCGRFFTHHKNLSDEERFQPYNEYKELRQHVSLCDGSSPILKKKEESMGKTKIPGCPLHPQLKFNSGPERGGHFRQQHPGWKTDPRLNPGLKKGAIASIPENLMETRAQAPEPLNGATNGQLHAEDIPKVVARTSDQMKQLASYYRSYAQQLAKTANELDDEAKKFLDKHGK